MEVKRAAAQRIKELHRYFPVVAVVGPRQSGKTTLIKQLFPHYEYFNLENPSTLAFIENDPEGFIRQHKRNTIIDEIQRFPLLLSYIQASVDEKRINGSYVISGSQNLLLSDRVNQSLAGRAAYCELLPFSAQELASAGLTNRSLYETIFSGSFPGIYHDAIPPRIFFDQYTATYVERDVKLIRNIGDLSVFRRFLALVAGRCGQLVDYASLANDVGVSANTIRSWVSILEASYIIFVLPPYHSNFGKRQIKSSKLYFTDTGLACRLLGIRTASELETHPLLGGLFENYVITEVLKQTLNFGLSTKLNFFRDSNGNEVDLLLESGTDFIPVEIKASATFSSTQLKGLKYWDKLAPKDIRGTTDDRSRTQKANVPNAPSGYLVYSGAAGQTGFYELIHYDDLTPLYQRMA